jgi:hypothetical protein
MTPGSDPLPGTPPALTGRRPARVGGPSSRCWGPWATISPTSSRMTQVKSSALANDSIIGCTCKDIPEKDSQRVEKARSVQRFEDKGLGGAIFGLAITFTGGGPSLPHARSVNERLRY